jgi:DNA-binding MurR/RpiR family transcriptional regulator
MAVTGRQKVSADQLIKRISGEYDHLSKQLKVIALHIEKNRDHIGIEGIQALALQCGVQPSAVVRFAQHFGFTGFSQMQAIFRDDLSRQLAPTRNYKTRIRDLIASGPENLSSADIAREFLTGSATGIHALEKNIDANAFKNAVEALATTDCIWIAACRRSFPIAVYLDYALQHTEKRIGLVSGLGGMHVGQVRSVRKGDVMIAISFSPYAEETISTAKLAAERGARLVVISDSRMSPVAKMADITLLVQDNSTFGFRSLSSTMALAQGLFIALAYALELPYTPTTV